MAGDISKECQTAPHEKGHAAESCRGGAQPALLPARTGSVVHSHTNRHVIAPVFWLKTTVLGVVSFMVVLWNCCRSATGLLSVKQAFKELVYNIPSARKQHTCVNLL